MTGPEGAAHAAERLLGTYADELYRFARFSLGSASEAEDIVQEVFMRAFSAWDRFSGRSSERTWLFSIARHVIADSLRNRRRERTDESSDGERNVPAPPDWRMDLEGSLRLLPVTQRQVFILRIIEDRSVGETAALLGRTQVWVRVTLHRAVSRLRSELAGANTDFGREGGIV